MSASDAHDGIQAEMSSRRRSGKFPRWRDRSPTDHSAFRSRRNPPDKIKKKGPKLGGSHREVATATRT